MTLGQRIQLLRKEKKLSQEYLAEQLCVSRQAVSKWENDLSAPDTENLIQLAKLLETDVAYLATGELSAEMAPEPVAEKPTEPPGPRRKRKKLAAVLLVLSLFLNILLAGLWQYEKRNEEKLEQFCTAAAYGARECFADYAHYGKTVCYWQGVAEYRGFMQAYYLLMDGKKGGNYSSCSELYSNLLYEQERVEPYLEELRRAMRMLAEDIYDDNAFLEIDKLNNLIAYGE